MTCYESLAFVNIFLFFCFLWMWEWVSTNTNVQVERLDYVVPARAEEDRQDDMDLSETEVRAGGLHAARSEDIKMTHLRLVTE